MRRYGEVATLKTDLGLLTVMVIRPVLYGDTGPVYGHRPGEAIEHLYQAVILSGEANYDFAVRGQGYIGPIFDSNLDSHLEWVAETA